MTTTTTECTTCRIERKRQNGEDITQQERNHWSMWGCTCDPQDEANAIEWMDRNTR